jgi:hypothetical protein
MIIIKSEKNHARYSAGKNLFLLFSSKRKCLHPFLLHVLKSNLYAPNQPFPKVLLRIYLILTYVKSTIFLFVKNITNSSLVPKTFKNFYKSPGKVQVLLKIKEDISWRKKIIGFSYWCWLHMWSMHPLNKFGHTAYTWN